MVAGVNEHRCLLLRCALLDTLNPLHQQITGVAQRVVIDIRKACSAAGVTLLHLKVAAIRMQNNQLFGRRVMQCCFKRCGQNPIPIAISHFHKTISCSAEGHTVKIFHRTVIARITQNKCFVARMLRNIQKRWSQLLHTLLCRHTGQ